MDIFILHKIADARSNSDSSSDCKTKQFLIVLFNKPISEKLPECDGSNTQEAPASFTFLSLLKDFKKQVIGLDFSKLAYNCYQFRSNLRPMNMNEDKLHYMISVTTLVKK